MTRHAELKPVAKTVNNLPFIESTVNGLFLRLKVITRAPKNKIEGVIGDALKVKIASPPVDGEANKELITFLSGVLNVKKSLLTIDSGEKSRIKRVRVDGITRLTLEEALTKNISMRIIPFVAAVFFALAMTGTVLAQTKSEYTPKSAIPSKDLIADGEYEMTQGESAQVGVLRAERNAKKSLIDKAIAHIKGAPKVSGLKLDDEEMRAAISSIIDVSVVDKKTIKKKDTASIRVKLKARITAEKLVKIIERARDKSFVKRFRLVSDAYGAAESGIAVVKEAFKTASTPNEKSVVAGKIKSNERQFQAAVFFEDGFRRDLAKDPGRAIEAYTKAIEFNSEFAYAYNNRGLALSEKGRFEDALKDFSKAIALKGDFAFAYNNRGLAYADTAQYALAIEDYNKAITLHPKDADTFNNRGIVWLNKNEYGKALVDFDKAVELNPEGALVYINRGNAHKGLLKYDKAIADFNKAVELRPDVPAAYINRGVARAYKKDFDAALKDFDKAIELDKNNADAYNNRANAYRHKELYDKAIADYTKALSLNPKLSYAYYGRANIYKQKGEVEKAIEDFTKHISLTPDNADAYGSRAFLYYKKGLVDKAVEDFKKACAMGDKYSCKSLKKLGKK
ncbi:MAG: DUF167 domain-containing protein [Deltaproteobacteria bacterium]|nr:DUF167 domain-containing protein [Deltaproteobacteria bacterium]